MPIAKLSTVEMYYEIHGKGEPLVLVAGFSADHLGWMMVLDELAQQFKVIVLDNRGAGQSTTPQGPYSVEQMAADTAELLTQLNITQAHLLGNSMGGTIVQQFARQYPERVKSIIISNSYQKISACYAAVAQGRLAMMQQTIDDDIVMQVTIPWVFSRRFIEDFGLDEIIAIRKSNPYPISIEGYQNQLSALNNFDSTAWLREISLPALVLAGNQDIICLEQDVKSMHHALPNSSYHCFTAGHAPHMERPEEFSQVVTNFIQSSNLN